MIKRSPAKPQLNVTKLILLVPVNYLNMSEKYKFEDLCFYHSGLLEDRRKFMKMDIVSFVEQALGHMLAKQETGMQFKDFNLFWQAHDIHLLHQFPLEWESPSDYYNLIYELILERLVYSSNHIEKVILFYLLYAIFATMTERVLISLNTDIMNQLYFFFLECVSRKDYDVFIIFQRIHKEKGFLVSTRVGPKTLAIHPTGLPYSVTKRNKETLREISEDFEEPEEANHRRQLIRALQEASQTYHKSKERANLREIDLTDKHFVQRCIHTLSNIQNS